VITKEAFIAGAASMEGKNSDGIYVQMLLKAKVDITQVLVAAAR
jgi:hypothetical protein